MIGNNQLNTNKMIPNENRISKIRLPNRMVKSSNGILLGLNSSKNPADCTFLRIVLFQYLSINTYLTRIPVSLHRARSSFVLFFVKYLGSATKSILILYFSDTVDNSLSMPNGLYSD